MPGDREPSEDELARTATVGATATVTGEPGRDVPPVRDSDVGDQLGRYKLQREIGRGGMGVVHAAFDPDLERRVALKVLPVTSESVEARQRLLREARAMARLAHPNVVTVHEVGTAKGRDFIAMELVDGKTLEDWLSAKPRTEREIIEAYVAAGRGLAAAHAAGLVHRDFKPRNVLRHRDGRIAVTDFGLVVGVEAQADAFTTTLPSGGLAALDETTTPSSLSGLTKTGSVLGTPAYMAPEQWTGGTIGPPADQFAFCVALWEALAKERPYRGDTLEALKEKVIAGRRADDSKIPRKLRGVLRRGLDPDPAKRYPDMNALLAAIVRTERRPTLLFALGAAAIVAAVVVYFVAARSPTVQKTYVVGERCSAPVLAPDKVWTAGDLERLRAAQQGLAADLIDADMKAWHELRARACKAQADVREPQLACLDGVLSRIDTVKQALGIPNVSPQLEINELLVDPATCNTAQPPRLTRVMSGEMRGLIGRYLVSQTPGRELKASDAAALIAAAGGEPCALSFAHQMAVGITPGSERADHLARAERASQECADDRLLADTAMLSSMIAGLLAENELRTGLQRSEALAARVSEPFLEAQLEQQRVSLAMISDDIDGAVAHSEKALELFRDAGAVRSALTAQLDLTSWKDRRGGANDFAGRGEELATLRADIVKKLGESDRAVANIDARRADWMWQNGDLAGAEQLRRKLVQRDPAFEPHVIAGQVVDDKGPVEGAEVTVAPSMWGDSLRAAETLGSLQRSTVTGADGRFSISDVETKSYLIAQHGDQRSAAVLATPNMTVMLTPTSRVSGTVDLRGHAPSQVTLIISAKSQPKETPYYMRAPIGEDGTFSVDGVPRGAVLFQTSVALPTARMVAGKEVNVSKPVVEGVRLEVKASARPLNVLVRSIYGAPIVKANVFLIAGKQPPDGFFGKMFSGKENYTPKLALPPQPEQQTPIVRARMKSGDLLARFAQRPEGEVSVCAMPMPDRLDDPQFQAAGMDLKRLEKWPVKCVPMKSDDELVEIAIPPLPRFD
ncbi:MAG TPA: protein kinase [Kofleriaceae bacterium]|nr:protein kinase [Kofleriaceae bacterium]